MQAARTRLRSGVTLRNRIIGGALVVLAAGESHAASDVQAFAAAERNNDHTGIARGESSDVGVGVGTVDVHGDTGVDQGLRVEAFLRILPLTHTRQPIHETRVFLSLIS